MWQLKFEIVIMYRFKSLSYARTHYYYCNIDVDCNAFGCSGSSSNCKLKEKLE